MTQAETLYRLQEIELALLRGQKRLGEIMAALSDNQTVQAAQRRLDEAEKVLRPLRAKMRDLEMETESNVEKTRTTEQRLYSGHVKNPKELQDMQQEIVSLKNWHNELENRLLEIMLAVEEAEAALDEVKANLQHVMAAWETEHQDLLAEKKRLEQQHTQLQEQRKEVLKQISPESLKTYNNLKPRKNNQPVSILNGRSCTVCGIEQTMAVEQEVRRGNQLVTCLNCGRILVSLRS